MWQPLYEDETGNQRKYATSSKVKSQKSLSDWIKFLYWITQPRKHPLLGILVIWDNKHFILHPLWVLLQLAASKRLSDNSSGWSHSVHSLQLVHPCHDLFSLLGYLETSPFAKLMSFPSLKSLSDKSSYVFMEQVERWGKSTEISSTPVNMKHQRAGPELQSLPTHI